MNSIIEWDQAFFQLINGGLANPFLDWLCTIVRNAWVWAPLYAFLAGLIIVNFGKKGMYLVLAGALLAGITDYTTSSILKPAVNRPRPCQDVQMVERVRQVVRCGAAPSFPSAHAANHFGLAVLLGLALRHRLPQLRFWLFGWASLIIFSQVYVGVHYPLDVLFGAVWGATLAHWAWILYRRLFGVLGVESEA